MLTTNSAESAALDYARNGWHVFPLIPRDKKPLAELAPKGFQNATTDDDTIRQWFRTARDANVAIRTGEVSGLLPLDIDGDDGRASLALLEQQHGPLPATVTVITGKGEQRYFKYPTGLDVRNSAGKVGKGLDIRGNGGYVVAVPSIHPNGKRYRWADGLSPDDVAIAEMPKWLLDRIITPTAATNRNGTSTTFDMAAALAGFPEGQRNAGITSLVGKLRRDDVPLDYARALVLQCADSCTPPYDHRTAEGILERGYQRWEPVKGDKPSTNGHATPLPLPEPPADDDAAILPSWQSTAPVPQQSLDDVIATFTRWLYLPTPHLVYVVLAVIAACFMPGDPLWLMLVGASSGGKTELLNSLVGIPHVRAAATITEASLLSGTSKKEKAADAKGGLLKDIGDFGILLLKDFTSILSMNRDQRAALLAALREIYDGAWTRNVGIDGGRTLNWEGKLGLLAGCTAAIDSAHAVMAAMGERFILFRLPEIDDQQQARKALQNAGKERELRQALRDAVTGFFAGLHIPDSPPEIDDNETDRLIALAALVARSRSAVERDGQTREIELILDSEAPARIAQALRRLFSGLLVIGLDRITAWGIVVKAGLDCMPKARRAAFDVLAAQQDWISTPKVATSISHPTATTKRALEDLTAHHIAERQSGGQGKADEWRLTPMAAQWYATIAIGESEMSESVKSNKARLFTTPDTMYDDISDSLTDSGCEEGEV